MVDTCVRLWVPEDSLTSAGVGVSGLAEILEIGTNVLGATAHQAVRLPNPVRDPRQPDPSIRVEALWTTDGLPPRWDNLALVAQREEHQDALEGWIQRFSNWPTRGVLLYGDGRVTLVVRSRGDEIRRTDLSWDALDRELRRWRECFAPAALAKFQEGQLSLYHSLPAGGPEVLGFLNRERVQLENALHTALHDGLDAARSRRSRTNPQDAITVAIAYVAARILEDKGYFGHRGVTDDPQALISRTRRKTNGFFDDAYRNALPRVSRGVLQVFAANLGANANFSLVNHHDIGHLYEHLLSVLPETAQVGIFRDLQSHYTPIALAERILEHLPVENLPPQERVAFDPAAGSGTLLLAATSRLLSASADPGPGVVLGNDLNHTAKLITQLRFTLAAQVYGEQRFPKPAAFTTDDYETLKVGDLRQRPRILIANPPFQEQGREQRAARFISHCMSWLTDGALFGIILPQSFLTGTSHGIPDARRLLAERSELFEVWQYPEGVAGLAARQPIAVVLGRVGKPKRRTVVARGVISGAEAAAVREEGYLGTAWVATLPDGADAWSETVYPTFKARCETVPLGAVCEVFTGVTQRANIRPIAARPKDGRAKRYWRTVWLGKGRIWADPESVDPNEQWIRYDRASLEAIREEHAKYFDESKIFVARVGNRNSSRPLKAHLDTEGLCPNNNVYCVVPVASGLKDERAATPEPRGWRDLTRSDRLLWLLGVLASETGTALSLQGRPTRNLPKDKLLNLPLPGSIDAAIIDVVRRWVGRDKARQPVPEKDQLKRELDRLVRRSYGNPVLPPITRVGVSADFTSWADERDRETFTVVGQVLEVQPSSVLHLYLNAWDEDPESIVVPVPPELPGWTLDGTVFEAQLSVGVKSAEELVERRAALRNFRVLGRPYASIDELELHSVENDLLS